MAYTVRRIDYFYAMVSETPEGGYQVLSELSQQGVNLIAVTAVPFGPTRTQLTIFPDDSAMLQHAAQAASIPIDGPHPALVVQGDDEVGALAHIHEKLRDANVAVFASTGVADGRAALVTSSTSVLKNTNEPLRPLVFENACYSPAPFPFQHRDGRARFSTGSHVGFSPQAPLKQSARYDRGRYDDFHQHRHSA